MHTRASASPRVWIVGIALASCAFHACTRALTPPAEPPSAGVVAELWREPHDLEARDLFLGPGGPGLKPGPATYAFESRKESGTNPGFDVRDTDGLLWSVKLGREAQSEVAVSRILWAVGFHQPPVYYVERWTLAGSDEAGRQPAGRFRAELPEHEVVDEWSWYENPFVGTRPFAVLIAVNVLVTNWDLKTANNKIYRVKNEDGVAERRYVVRDLGGSLGKAKQPRLFSWVPFMRHKQGSKNDLADFESQRFVKGIDGPRVEFEYRGIDDALVDSVSPEDLRWTCTLLSRLSERQWLDAFRAGGYTEDERVRFVRKIREKIAEAQAHAPQPAAKRVAR